MSSQPPIVPPYQRAIPKPIGSPLVAAAGVTLLFAGLVTNWVVTIVGAVLALGGAIAWFRQVFPEEVVEEIPEWALRRGQEQARGMETAHEGVERAKIAVEAPRASPSGRAAAREVVEGPRRLALPLEIHPYRVGVWGGLAGGAAMAIVACAWGVIFERSLWLPINLLAGVFLPGIESQGLDALRAFDPGWLLTALGIHLVGSIFVGLLYTVALPMMPRRPILFGGVVAPILWTGLVWASLGIVNPALAEYISWPWFIASQVAYGLAAGFVISRFNRVPTMQFLPLSQRLGVESTREGGEESQ